MLGMLGEERKSHYVREWVIFALCLGLGAHLALGVVLHAPEIWPISNLWWYGIILAISFYVLVQFSRSVYWLLKPENRNEDELR